MEWFLPVLSSLAVRIPVFAVWIFALILALSNWEHRRAVSGLVLAAVGVLGVSEVVSAVVFILLPTMLRERGWSMSQYGLASSVVGVLSSLGHALGYALLVVAIFSRQAQAPTASPPGV